MLTYCWFLSVDPRTFPCLTGDVTLDIPLSGLSGDAVRRRGALHRAAQVHQLLLQRVRLHAAAQHTVQSGLGALQDEITARQTEVFPVYIAWC